MKLLSLICILIVIQGCVTPAQRFNQIALELGFDANTITTEQFQHKIYSRKKRQEEKIVHVYIDGDGTPWERNRWISADPTTRNPLILRLMHQDPAFSILLGRPCYYGLSDSKDCDNKYWTSHRFSEVVVNSMSSALNSWLRQQKIKEVIVIGYSGGGSIATLIANKIQNITKVVTVAANLDIRKWVKVHGYLELRGSLNPLDQIKLNTSIKQLHFAGQDDDVVPSFIIKEYANRQINSVFYEFHGKGHSRGWEDAWPEILKLIEKY